jgi:hypothetical protein
MRQHVQSLNKFLIHWIRQSNHRNISSAPAVQEAEPKKSRGSDQIVIALSFVQ